MSITENKNIVNWLKSPMSHTNDIYDTLFLPDDFYFLNNIHAYFKSIYLTQENDIDLKHNDVETIKDLEQYYTNNNTNVRVDINQHDSFCDGERDDERDDKCDENYSNNLRVKALQNCVQSYESQLVLIPPGTIQAHTNYLFRKMIFIANGNKFECLLPNLTNIKNITYDKTSFINPQDKNDFYKFCFLNSHDSLTFNKGPSNKNIQFPVLLPILSKQTIGKLEYLNTIKKEKNKKIMDEEYQKTLPYPINDLRTVYDLEEVVIEQYEKFNELVNIIWTKIFTDYLDYKNPNKKILEKIPNSVLGKAMLQKLLFNTSTFCKLKNINEKILITKNKLEHEKKLHDEEELRKEKLSQLNESNIKNIQKQCVKKIDTSKLVGMLN